MKRASVHAHIRRTGLAAGVLGITVFLAVFLIWPLAHVFRHACVDESGMTTLYLRQLFSDPLQRAAILRSLTIAALVTTACLGLATPLAWLFARYRFAGKEIFAGLLLMPLLMPPFVGALGMKMVFARGGALSTLLMQLGVTDAPVDWLGSVPLLGIIVLETLHLFPILHLNLVAAFANIDPNLEETAANLGASPWRVFRRVTLPLAGPGLFAGLVLVFIWSFTELGTPLVFGVRRVVPVMIFDAVNEMGTHPMGYAQVVLVLVFTVAGFWLSKRLTRSRRHVATLGRMSVASAPRRLSGLRTVLVCSLMSIVLVLAVLPHISVVLLSVSRRWFLTVLPEGYTLEFFYRALGSDLTQTALRNSLALSVAALVITVCVGFALAWICVRERFAGADGLDALAMMPLAVPGVVLAFGYMGTYAGAFPGSMLDPRTNPMLLLAVSYAVRRLPYMLRAAHAGLEQITPSYEEAAANLGAPAWRVIWRITRPLITANLLAGGILCFAFSMLEVSDSLILAQSEAFYPLTKAIYVLMDGLENGLNVASALGVWAMALLAAALLWAASLLGRRMGEMFRAG